ncbi:undecaprenyl-diphosphate phosphatase [Geoglobus ahangari]
MEPLHLPELVALGIVQGVAEWLPVSSEGMIMLVLLNVFGTDVASAFSYAVFFHLGTMLAVLVKFRRHIVQIIAERSASLRIISIATVFTAFTALPLMLVVKNVEGQLANLVIGALLIVTGLFLRIPREGYRAFGEMSDLESAALGIAQGFAILPGISRSGTTVSYLLLRKIREEDALRLSFLVSIPATAGAVVIGGVPGSISVTSALIVLATTFVTGYLMIDVLLRVARSVGFSAFCIIFGSVAVIFTLISM